MKKQDVEVQFINNRVIMRDYDEKMISQGAKVLSDWKGPKSCKKIKNLD